MGRSQRHQLVEQNTTSNGEVHAEGEVAPFIKLQVGEEDITAATSNAPTVLTDIASIEEPVGPPGGPLQGSYVSGVIPEGAGGGGPPPEPPEDVAPVLASLDPDGSLIGDGDITVTIAGSGFTEASILVWNGADDVAEFVDETTMTTTVKTDLATVASICTVAVRNGDQVSNELAFEFVEPIPEDEAEEFGEDLPEPKAKKTKKKSK